MRMMTAAWSRSLRYILITHSLMTVTRLVNASLLELHV